MVSNNKHRCSLQKQCQETKEIKFLSQQTWYQWKAQFQLIFRWVQDVASATSSKFSLHLQICHRKGNILKVSLPLHPSTIDGCGKGTWWNQREQQASLEGNHENPMSSTHHAPSHWEPQCRCADTYQDKTSKGEGRLGQKRLKLLHTKVTWAKWLTSAKAL